ncbi:signal peptidase I [Streptomyces kebangsaanensis]|uniref:Signal peptidase I n=1 Tax=Streptomyces kebangsaanensis TaxID=864058 RepID=A0ABW6KUM2_9ACTN
MAGRSRGLGLAALVVGLVGLFLGGGAFVYGKEAYGGAVVQSTSMSPTYKPGDRVFYERVDGTGVRRGDVVLFSAPDRYGFEALVMWRVVGVGGDHVVCCTGAGADARVTVNGQPFEEPYVKDGDADGMHRAYDVKVPRGRLFLLGDHRANSMDSRFFASDHDGTVSVSAVQGRVVASRTELALLGGGVLVAAVTVLVGLGLGVASLVARPRRTVPPWPTRV